MPKMPNDNLATLLANHRRFLSFLESRVGNRQDAEEILQDAFVRTITAGDQIPDTENVIAWFYRVLRNAVIDRYRRYATSERAIERFAEELSHGDPSADPALRQAICECVLELVSGLKPEYAELIQRVDLDGMAVNTAADALGLSEGNARVRLHRARSALRKEVERTCRTCATHGCMDCSCKENQH